MAGSDLVVNLGLNATAFTRGLTSATAKLGVLGVAAGKTGLRRGSGAMNLGFMSLNRTLGTTKTLVTGIGLGLTAMAGKALTMAAHTEQMRISFEVLSGDADTGNAVFKEMEDLAQNTSLTIAETTQAAKKLIAEFRPAKHQRSRHDFGKHFRRNGQRIAAGHGDAAANLEGRRQVAPT